MSKLPYPEILEGGDVKQANETEPSVSDSY